MLAYYINSPGVTDNEFLVVGAALLLVNINTSRIARPAAWSAQHRRDPRTQHVHVHVGL